MLQAYTSVPHNAEYGFNLFLPGLSHAWLARAPAGKRGLLLKVLLYRFEEGLSESTIL